MYTGFKPSFLVKSFCLFVGVSVPTRMFTFSRLAFLSNTLSSLVAIPFSICSCLTAIYYPYIGVNNGLQLCAFISSSAVKGPTPLAAPNMLTLLFLKVIRLEIFLTNFSAHAIICFASTSETISISSYITN